MEQLYSWQTRNATEQENVDLYKEFLRTPEGQASIPTFLEELEKVQRYHNENDALSDDEDEEDAHHEQ